MRREGRQHGMVVWFERSDLLNSKPKTRLVNRLDSVPTTGWVTKVPSKPTNHSKYTSRCSRPRCGGCHTNPVSKSQAKAKGAHKLRRSDALADVHGFNHNGTSATEMLSHLRRKYRDELDYDDDNDDDASTHDDDDNIDLAKGLGEPSDGGINSVMKCDDAKMEEGEGEMGFYEVRFVCDLEDEENWCMMGGM